MLRMMRLPGACHARASPWRRRLCGVCEGHQRVFHLSLSPLLQPLFGEYRWVVIARKVTEQFVEWQEAGPRRCKVGVSTSAPDFLFHLASGRHV